MSESKPPIPSLPFDVSDWADPKNMDKWFKPLSERSPAYQAKVQAAVDERRTSRTQQ